MPNSPELLLPNSVGDIWCWVTSNKGERIDLSTEVAKIVLNEGIDEYHIFGHIDFFDVIGIRSDLPLLGQEKVEFSWLKEDTTIMHEMYISSIDTVTDINNVGYVRCYITTYSELLNEVRTFSKSFKAPISDIVAEIQRSKLNRELDVKESSNGSFAYIVPSIKPYEAFDHLLTRAYTASGSPLFLYQTVIDDNLKLESLETIQNKTKVADYYYAVVTNMDRSSAYQAITEKKNTMKVYSLDKAVNFDFHGMVSNGVIKASQEKYDIGRKTYQNGTYEYPSISNKGSGEWYTRYAIEGRDILKEPGKQMKTMRANEMAHRGNVFNTNTELLDRPMIATALYNERNAIELRVEMNSHPNIAAGKVIKLWVPNVNTNLSKQEPWDPMYTGNYVISRLTHVVEMESYRVNAVLIKNKVG